MSPEIAVPEQTENSHPLTYNQGLSVMIIGGLFTIAAAIIMVLGVGNPYRQELPQLLQQSNPAIMHSFPAITPLVQEQDNTQYQITVPRHHHPAAVYALVDQAKRFGAVNAVYDKEYPSCSDLTDRQCRRTNPANVLTITAPRAYQSHLAAMPENLDANHAEHQAWLAAGKTSSATDGAENLVLYRITIAAPPQWTPLALAGIIAFLLGAITMVLGYALAPVTVVPPAAAKV